MNQTDRRNVRKFLNDRKYIYVTNIFSALNRKPKKEVGREEAKKIEVCSMKMRVYNDE
jgi:hypothetical protein